MEEKVENVLKQEWLKNASNPKHLASIYSGNAFVVLLVNSIFPKTFSPAGLILYYFIAAIIGVWFYSFVWTYFAKFTFDKEGLLMKIAGSKISSKNIRYEKIIYASKHRSGDSFSLTLEVWFGRKPVVFSEILPSVEGRTEEVYHGEGMEAHYWTKKPGKIDELARFIDMYNAQAKVD